MAYNCHDMSKPKSEWAINKAQQSHAQSGGTTNDANDNGGSTNSANGNDASFSLRTFISIMGWASAPYSALSSRINVNVDPSGQSV